MPVQTINGVGEMQAFAGETRRQGKRIALVPTMGFLHQGHLSLMHEGRRRGDLLVVSIFVNPTQFGAGEDYESYPRDMERDRDVARQAGVDIIFAPTAREMYPAHYQTYVSVEEVTRHLCGASRPTHFRGVTTVVCKLFTIVKPHTAIFGEKDFQQLVVIRRMVADLNLEVEIVGMPTYREADGLAMSSRNSYLTPPERTAALCISRALKEAAARFGKGERRAEVLVQAAREIVAAEPLAGIDYITLCDTEELKDLARVDREAVLAMAVRIGRARLIDNVVLKP
jgi:pantoate--beta-alanine ligase